MTLHPSGTPLVDRLGAIYRLKNLCMALAVTCEVPTFAVPLKLAVVYHPLISSSFGWVGHCLAGLDAEKLLYDP